MGSRQAMDLSICAVSLKTVMDHDAATYEFGLLLLVAFFHNVKASKASLRLTTLTPRVNIASIEEDYNEGLDATRWSLFK